MRNRFNLSVIAKLESGLTAGNFSSNVHRHCGAWYRSAGKETLGEIARSYNVSRWTISWLTG
jgi:hypothetical protein